ncbi:DUF2513 domain-containing protein [Paenibacillus larvae]|uniref:Putative transcriptional regulator n=2 Tax=Fernvirus TaxID=2843380 RepID=A0A2I7SCI0_9CAUD|nr:DUF2513 domain-containing protein [Paenibacillus larvae]YP_009836305.1 DUF2513 domain-containing protein [Paenibacillus phage BN12]AUS03597.1 putative transcriptional regulator [Paenibacillus phage BN12]AXF40544.1 putative transcriptional regulator [Paenibacillus phage Toothless]MCY9720307.1 DUF2513 domain-containing protein [Paenibacillus larvae]
MKLKHDCVRELLLTIEEEIPLNGALDEEDLLRFDRMKEYSLDDVIYTTKMLQEAGYIDAKVETAKDGICFIMVKSLTYSGHFFLDNIRDDGIWKEAKTRVSTMKSVSVDILSEVASSCVKSMLGLN